MEQAKPHLATPFSFIPEKEERDSLKEDMLEEETRSKHKNEGGYDFVFQLAQQQTGLTKGDHCMQEADNQFAIQHQYKYHADQGPLHRSSRRLCPRIRARCIEQSFHSTRIQSDTCFRQGRLGATNHRML